MAHQITLIPGDGIGPEVAAATVRAVEATGVAIEWEHVEAGAQTLATHGQLIPDDVFASLEVTRVGLKGPTATPIGGGHQSINVALRKKLGLYTNFRPVRMLPGLKTRFHDLPLDLAIFRENTEDLYSGLEHEVVPGVVESLKIITRNASMKIACAAFEYARRYGRKKVTAIHKANIMKLSDGLFLKCCRDVSSKFPEIQYNELIVDNACMQLVMRPETFDVLVLPNLYGDIISDLAAGLVGGLGIVPGANIGDQHAIFEAVHGTAPDIAGKGLANPTALMQSAVLMLAHIGERDASARLQSAIHQAYAEKDHLTGDVGGSASTTEFTDAVVRRVQA
jgi:isocitrate dehydrogenase (NAD+)